MKVKLDNFIKFCFILHPNVNHFLDNDYNYIVEKWNTFIGKPPVVNENVEKHLITNMWIKRWKITDDKYLQLKEVLDFLVNIKPEYSLVELVDLFRKKTGLDIKDISDVQNNGLNVKLKELTQRWLDKKINIRDYKIIQIVEDEHF